MTNRSHQDAQDMITQKGPAFFGQPYTGHSDVSGLLLAAPESAAK